MINIPVTIIIPLYNKQNYIEDTIKNIISQTYTNWHLIIVDDCSTDNSLQIAKKYESSKIKIIENPQNYGVAKTRNIGLENAITDYVCFQDADDLWDVQKLEKQVNFMQKQNCAFSYTGFKYMKENGKINKKSIKIPEKLTYKEALKNTKILSITNMFNTKLIDKNLLKMPKVPAEDMATWWNILKHGYVAYGINEPLAYYRQVKKSLSANKLKSAKMRWNLYRKCEGFSIGKSLYYFVHYVFFAITKRI